MRLPGKVGEVRRNAALIVVALVAGVLGMYLYRVGEGLYADWAFLRYARVQAMQAQAQQSAPPTTQAPASPKP